MSYLFNCSSHFIHLSIHLLEALVECVHLRTFGKLGIQQMQVDAHYLQIYLWKDLNEEQ